MNRLVDQSQERWPYSDHNWHDRQGLLRMIVISLKPKGSSNGRCQWHAATQQAEAALPRGQFPGSQIYPVPKSPIRSTIALMLGKPAVIPLSLGNSPGFGNPGCPEMNHVLAFVAANQRESLCSVRLGRCHLKPF